MQRTPSRRRHFSRWAFALALLPAAAWSAEARAEKPNRRGGQIEGMVGATACIPGRAECKHDDVVLDGSNLPSFGTGVALAARPVKWFMVGAIYRYGMFNPSYEVTSGADYRWAAQHTVGLLMRPIIPVWRFDFGLNVAPSFARQVFRLDSGDDRDFSQGFAMLVGPNIDVFVTERFFIGAGADFIFNTQKKVCTVRGGDTDCSTKPERRVAPTHQVLFGLRLGGTFG